MSNVVQLFPPSADDDADEYVPSFPVSDAAAVMRERANRVYNRHLVYRGLSKGDVDGDGLTGSERGGLAKASAYRDGWTPDDQALVDAWLENDPWASRLAMKLDELAGKDSGEAKRSGKADGSDGLITHDLTDTCEAMPSSTTPPARGPKKAGAVPTREGGTPAPSPLSRVGSLAARDPPRHFVAPVEGPAEVVSTVCEAPDSNQGGAGASQAGDAQHGESSMRTKAGDDGLTDIQRGVLKAYPSTPSAKVVAAKLGLPLGTVKGTIHWLRARRLIAPAKAHGSNGTMSKPKIAVGSAAVATVFAPSPIAARAASAHEEDPLLEAMRQRREALIAEHRTRLARIDAAIAAFQGEV